MKKLLFIPALLLLGSCATIVRKDFKEDVTFEANGDSNVDVYVNDEYKGQAPTTVELDSREIYNVKYAKKGMEPVSYPMQGSVQPKYVVGDIVMGGVVLGWIPLIVDGVTNEWREFDEDDINYRYSNFDWNAGSYSGPSGDIEASAVDSDGDGVLDNVDDCPKVAGIKALNGCPEIVKDDLNTDSDGDGIMDDKDDCPMIKGLDKFNGCPDTDGDGIMDKDDKCPKLAGIKKLDGCPEGDNVDTDGDGIIDKVDKCPEVAGVAINEGCPLEGEDSDGDGIIDSKDDCPKIAGLPGLKGCPDADGDGVTDADDKCPNVIGVKSNDGCPLDTPEADIDTDGDGIFDKVDKCPKVAGVAANAGCPLDVPEADVDTDGDGIFDKVDKCPKVAGVPELEGCPKVEDASHGADGKIILNTGDHGQITNWQDIQASDLPDVSGKMFEINNLNFETGSSTINASSYAELDEVVAFLKRVPEAKLDVEGHTDSQGSDSGNLSLSQKRAKAVVDYLVSKGINASRLDSHGYGEAKPVATNDTSEGRARNRRVEFHIQ